MIALQGLWVHFLENGWTETAIFATVAAVISFLAYPFYMYSIFFGKTVPHPFTWIAYTFLSGVTMFMFWNSGGEYAGLMMIGDCVGFFLIAVISIFLWEKKKRCFDVPDILVFSGAMISIGIYILTKNSFVGFLAALIAEVLAILPTLRKTYNHPDEEDFLAWTLTFAGDAINIFAIRTAADMLYVWIIYAIDGSVWTLIAGRRKKFLFWERENSLNRRFVPEMKGGRDVAPALRQ